MCIGHHGRAALVGLLGVRLHGSIRLLLLTLSRDPRGWDRRLRRCSLRGLDRSDVLFNVTQRDCHVILQSAMSHQWHVRLICRPRAPLSESVRRPASPQSCAVPIGYLILGGTAILAVILIRKDSPGSVTSFEYYLHTIKRAIKSGMSEN